MGLHLSVTKLYLVFWLNLFLIKATFPSPFTMLLGTTGYKRQSGGEREGAIDLAGAATPLMALSHPFSGISSRSYDDLQIKNYSENLEGEKPYYIY